MIDPMSIARILAAGAALSALAMLPAAAQDFSQSPTYGTVNLTSGFTPDPNVVNVQSGGAIDATTLNSRPHSGNCTGMIANAPDVRVNYTSGQFQRLIVSVNSSADTTLVINGPDGQWYCDDDGGQAGLNPAITFSPPQSGQYDIWIGTYGSNALQAAQLNVSEVSSQ
jgi:hypothetical protein